MIIEGLTDTFRAECLWGGIHLPTHEYWLALYNDQPEQIVLGPDTMAYTPENEVQGLGYQPGGKKLEGRSVQILEGIVCLDWQTPMWPVATLRDVAGCLIYNRSLPQKNSVGAFRFEEPITAINGPFAPSLPEPGPQTSLVRWK